MADLYNVFQDTHITLRLYRITHKNLAQLEKKLNILEQKLRNITQGQLSIFIDENKLELHHFKNLLIELYNKNLLKVNYQVLKNKRYV
jgi:hypothetical protein